jgi:anti-sigma regulatory factor (Ser/Thr protein kinase)
MSHLRPASLTGPSRELVVDPDVADVSDARQFVREHCHALGFDADACDTAVLLTSETVTNAVTHGRSEARIRVTATPGLMLVEVADGNSRHPQRQPQDPDALDGRGMSIIDLLAARWGVRDDPYGKTVWFEVRSPSDLDGTAPE